MRDLDCDSKNSDKSLLKSESRFKETDVVYHGGTHGSKGQFFKESGVNNKAPKPYYRARRDGFHEYFAFEILNAIGLSTPKVRFIESNKSVELATKAIDHFMPLQAYWDNWPYSNFLKPTPDVLEVQRRYRLNVHSQVIEDKDSKQQIKITGNLFAANLGAYLLQDTDLTAEGTNLALVKEGGRFHAYFIDKEFASFEKKQDYNALSAIQFHGLEPILEAQTQEQKLAVIYAIQKLITPDPKSNQSTLERIFFNNRTASVYKSYLNGNIAHAALSAFHMGTPGFKIQSTGDQGTEFITKEPLFLANNPLFKTLIMDINATLGNKSWDLNNEHNIEANNPIQVSQFIEELAATIPNKEIHKRIAGSDAYNKLTVADLLQPLLGENQLLEQTEYQINFANNEQNDLTGFTFTKEMSLEEFTKKYYNFMYHYHNNGYRKDLSYIPFDPRVMCDNIQNNAQCIINNTLKETPDALKEFEQRESYRQKIAYKVMEHIGTDITLYNPMQKALFTNIVEDLRGPYYTSFFDNGLNTSENDIYNQALINKIYADNRAPLEENRDQIKTRLEQYIKRINQDGQDSINFSNGFNFFVCTQTLNRRANYHLATQLLSQLNKSNDPAAELFDAENIHELRQQFFEKEGLCSKLISFNLFGWGIHSEELKSIIDDVQEDRIISPNGSIRP